MIVCKQCGHHNEDNDTFCGSCGKFLEWTGERVAVAEPEPPPPAPEPEPEPAAKVGFMDRVKQAVGLEESGSVPGTAESPAQSGVAPAASASPATAGPVAAAAAPARPAEPVLAGVASAPTPMTAAPSMAPADPASRPPSAAEPTSRRPTAVAAPRRPTAARTMEAPTRRHPGDLICGQCGEGNDPERHFCRRCGSGLDEAIAVRLPWYRRFFGRVFGRRTYQAGERHRRVGPPNVMGGVMRVARLAILALLITGVLAFILVPPFHDRAVSTATTAITAIRKIVHPNYDPVNPIQAVASSQTAGHPANLAIDHAKNTYWAAGPGDTHIQLQLRFAAPEDLADVGFTSGASGATPADFLAQPRPHNVHVIFQDAKGGLITASDLVLKDTADFQPFTVDAKQATIVVIQIQSTYAATGASASSVALAEVEFKIKD